MNFTLQVSKLMKVSEVRKLCKEMRENKHAYLQLEVQYKAEMYRRISPKKEKAAS
ncbi:hypothetical protein [Neobacillus niacini]|uniref:hypothetical protein n=1 Tax=Neobacillus niacini TaxID=86668 RepID=UPI002FFE3403